MQQPGPSYSFESSQLFLLNEEQYGLALVKQSREFRSYEDMSRLVDSIREHMYYHAGSVFANLESVACAVRLHGSKGEDSQYVAALIGGALAYAYTWFQLGEEMEELPESIAQSTGIWAPDQVETIEDIGWVGDAMVIGQQEWERDPVLQRLVKQHARPFVNDSDLQICYDVAGFTKYSVAVAKLFTDRQNAWLASQIADLESGQS